MIPLLEAFLKAYISIGTNAIAYFISFADWILCPNWRVLFFEKAVIGRGYICRVGCCEVQ